MDNIQIYTLINMLFYYKAQLFYILVEKHVCLQYCTQEFISKCTSTIRFFIVIEMMEKNIVFELNVHRKNICSTRMVLQCLNLHPGRENIANPETDGLCNIFLTPNSSFFTNEENPITTTMRPLVNHLTPSNFPVCNILFFTCSFIPQFVK